MLRDTLVFREQTRAMPLTLWGNPILDGRSTELGPGDFGPELAALCARMLEVMYRADGAGLAAAQVGLPKRFFVYDCQGHKGAIANPVIIDRSRDLLAEDEGCLSIPGFRWSTPRAAAVTVAGQDPWGEPITLHASDYLARCMQHEIDHLDGRLYLSRLGGKLGKRARLQAKASTWYGTPSRFVPIDD